MCCPLRRAALALLTVLVVLGGGVATASAEPIVVAGGGEAPDLVVDRLHRVLDDDFPDPGFLLSSAGRYYLYATGPGFRVATSARPDRGFSTPRPSMPGLPRWVGLAPDNGHRLWAPHVASMRTTPGRPRFVMYFSGHHRTRGQDCLGTATSRSPLGPFRPARRPLLCGEGARWESIDPSVHRVGGARYLLWKAGNYRRHRFEIRARRLSASGTRLVGPRAQVLAAADESIEAPSLVRARGRLWLFVARGYYARCSYRTEVWTSASLDAPFTRHGVLPLVHPNGQPFCGPGGVEVIRDGGGHRLAFHVWRDGTPRSAVRQTWTGRVRWLRAPN